MGRSEILGILIGNLIYFVEWYRKLLAVISEYMIGKLFSNLFVFFFSFSFFFFFGIFLGGVGESSPSSLLKIELSESEISLNDSSLRAA